MNAFQILSVSLLEVIAIFSFATGLLQSVDRKRGSGVPSVVVAIACYVASILVMVWA